MDHNKNNLALTLTPKLRLPLHIAADTQKCKVVKMLRQLRHRHHSRFLTTLVTSLFVSLSLSKAVSYSLRVSPPGYTTSHIEQGRQVKEEDGYNNSTSISSAHTHDLNLDQHIYNETDAVAETDTKWSRDRDGNHPRQAWSRALH